MLLKNCKRVGGEKIDILILNGKIYKIAENIPEEEGKAEILRITGENCDGMEIIDVKGKYIMPGIIDPHTHMRDPGLTQKEDFRSGSMACAKAGITTFLDMPNTKPETVNIKALENKRKIAEKKSIVNYGFHFGGSSDDNSEEIKKVKGVTSVKVFLNVSTGKMLVEDETTLKNIISNSKFLSVHAEDEMITKALEYNKDFGKGLYICHISSEKEMKMAERAKKDPYFNNDRHPVYVEVTPHHLFLDSGMRKDSHEKDQLYRMKPELKSAKDREYLWKSLNNGNIDTIGTDHAPHLKSEKLEKLIFGMPGVETSLALMLTACNEGKISLTKIQELMCENPAKIFKLTGKGQLKEGFDADIIIIDIEKEWTVTKEGLLSKCGWSPYEGWKLKGKNEITIVNGIVVFRDNKIIENKGREVEINE